MTGESKDPIFYANMLNKFAFVKSMCVRDDTRTKPRVYVARISRRCTITLNVIIDRGKRRTIGGDTNGRERKY